MVDLVIVAVDLALVERERLEIALWDRRCAPNWSGWKGRFGWRKAKRCAERFPADHIAEVVRGAVEDVDAVLAVLGASQAQPAGPQRFAAKPVAPVDGCQSAFAPCAHQKVEPTTLCGPCQRAAADRDFDEDLMPGGFN